MKKYKFSFSMSGEIEIEAHSREAAEEQFLAMPDEYLTTLLDAGVDNYDCETAEEEEANAEE